MRKIFYFAFCESVLQFASTKSLAKQFSNPNVAFIPPESTYLLPQPFQGNLSLDFVDGTTVSNSTIDTILEQAQQAPFISYSQEFNDLLGPNAELTTIVPRNGSEPLGFAGEAGAWVPDLNQVWFTSTLYTGPTVIRILYLDNNTVVQPNFTATRGYGDVLPLANPGGGYYFGGKVYMALNGNDRDASSLVAIDVHTWEVTPVVNSYFGLEFPVFDDVAVTYSNTDQGMRTHIYFSVLSLAAFDLSVGRPPAVIPNSFWMFTPETQTIQPVITRADILTPNGVSVGADFRHLYLTDTSATAVFGGGGLYNNTGSPAIYRFDINPDDGLISNKVLLGFTREGVSDGIKVDDNGRVWTAEYEGIVVRNKYGKVIGLVNKEILLRGNADPSLPITNFAIAGDKLIIQAVDTIQMVQFPETLISPERYSYPPS